MKGVNPTGRGELKALQAEINFKLAAVTQLSEVIRKWTGKLTPQDPQEEVVTTIGFNLMRFYTGAEDILEQIVKLLDDYRPTGPDWHVKLLLLATAATEDRPAVIRSETYELLNELRGFRHIAQKAYLTPLNWEQMQRLTDDAVLLLKLFREDLTAFNGFLAKINE